MGRQKRNQMSRCVRCDANTGFYIDIAEKVSKADERRICRKRDKNDSVSTI